MLLSPRRSIFPAFDITMLQLAVEDFKKYLISSEVIIESALKNNKIKDKINSLNSKLFQQTFLKSCTAVAIMMALVEFDCLRVQDCTPSKEAEIYSSIWSSPGKEADPHKVVRYLQKYKLPISCLVFTDITSKILNAEPSLSFVYNHFLKVPTKIFKKNVHWLLRNKNIFNHSCFLIIKSNKNGTLHTLFGQDINEEEGFIVKDPGNNSSELYDSFYDYIRLNKNFTGVVFYLGESISLVNKKKNITEPKIEKDLGKKQKGKQKEIEHVKAQSALNLIEASEVSVERSSPGIYTALKQKRQLKRKQESIPYQIRTRSQHKSLR